MVNPAEPSRPHQAASERDRIAVLAEEANAAEAADLATQLSVPLVRSAAPGPAYLLVGAGSRLEVLGPDSERRTRICVDFVGGPEADRWASSAADTPVARAIGCRRGTRTVIDATAGLGRDAFLLATCGCEVRALERSPVVAALLADALRREADDTGKGPRFDLVCADARTFLRELDESDRPDAIYFDPMLPAAKKTALVKKEMRFLQDFLGPDQDAHELFETARSVARRRVVVKRPLHAAPLAAPNAQMKSRRARWDVYLTEPR